MRADVLPAAGLDHALDMRTMRTFGFPGLDEREHALVGRAVEDANGLTARHLREVRLDLLQDLPERRELFAAGFESDDEVNQGSLSREYNPCYGVASASGCGGGRRRLLFESELLHAPIERLSTQPQLARRARDDAAGTCQSAFDLCTVGLALGNHLQRPRRHHQAEVGGRNRGGGRKERRATNGVPQLANDAGPAGLNDCVLRMQA